MNINKNTTKHRHLTLDERISIQNSLNERMSFKAIGSLVGKDCTTISKEIKSHISFIKKGAPYRPFNDCIHRRNCKVNHRLCDDCNNSRPCSSCGKCIPKCEQYEKENCSLLLKAPYVCNGCSESHKCTLEKHLYIASSAQKEYEEVRSESRSGVNLTEQELQQLDSVISPLLMNGQSLHHIMVNNQDSISCCEKTAYNYVNANLFEARNIDMPRVVRFKPRKNKSVRLKVDKKCRIGRTYEDYKIFMAAHPSLPVVELDTVEGVKGGAVLLTVHFVLQKLQLYFLRDSNTSASVSELFDSLYKALGPDTFKKLFPVLLADNGTEFSNPLALEFDADGNRRSYVFYCDPSAPNQKGSCEVNHEFVRRIIPKGTDIGIYTQEHIRLMTDHINSYSRPELGDKTPYAMFCFYYGKKVLNQLGIHLVDPNDVILKPDLLQNKAFNTFSDQ